VKVRVEDRNLTRELRRRGHSYGEIRRVIRASKGALNYWLKNIELSQSQKDAILARTKDLSARGRQIGAWRNRLRSRQRAQRAKVEARREFPAKLGHPLFVTGLALWWAEGTKTERYFQFMNSDPKAIRVMMKWLLNCAEVPKSKIVASVQVHRIYAYQGSELYWQGVTSLPPSQFRSPVFKPTPHTAKKNPSYMGCCRLNVFSVDLFWKLQAWHQELIRLLGIRLPQSGRQLGQ